MKKIIFVAYSALLLLLCFNNANATSMASSTGCFDTATFSWSITGDAVIRVDLSLGEPAVPYAYVETNDDSVEDDPRNRDANGMVDPKVKTKIHRV